MSGITKSSTAEYFAKNLQQVGFSSPVKAVLTTLKEAVDNSLDACEEEKILPEIKVNIQRKEQPPASSKKSVELVEVSVEDNGPGLNPEEVVRVFGEYLASSKFGRGRCTRGQQGIGISAATTWAQLTHASGVDLVSKTTRMPKALKAQVTVDIKKNKGIMKKKSYVSWSKSNGLKTSFCIEGRIQIKGDGGLLTYLEGTALVNPHLSLHYKINEEDWQKMERVSNEVPVIPQAVAPHPHTMKLGEFISYAHLFGRKKVKDYLLEGFSKVSKKVLEDIIAGGVKKSYLEKSLTQVSDQELKDIFKVLQNTKLLNPSTSSVLTIGEEVLAKSIQRLGKVDFFSVITRKPGIFDHKPVVVECAVARLMDRPEQEEENKVRLLRFANRVPLQFDKAACAITQAVESVNWRSYGLAQNKNTLPMGPYVFAVSVTSPFIKFKNASKETIDATEDLVEEIRRALMQTGLKLSRHIKREKKAHELQKKVEYIKQFVPILVKKLGDITKADKNRLKKAKKGVEQLLSQETRQAEEALKMAENKLFIEYSSISKKEQSSQKPDGSKKEKPSKKTDKSKAIHKTKANKERKAR